MRITTSIRTGSASHKAATEAASHICRRAHRCIVMAAKAFDTCPPRVCSSNLDAFAKSLLYRLSDSLLKYKLKSSGVK